MSAQQPQERFDPSLVGPDPLKYATDAQPVRTNRAKLRIDEAGMGNAETLDAPFLDKAPSGDWQQALLAQMANNKR